MARTRHPQSSGLLAADAVVCDAACWFHGAVATGDGTNDDQTLLIYDNATSAAGTCIATLAVSIESHTVSVMLPTPLPCANGIYADESTNLSNYIVYYSLAST